MALWFYRLIFLPVMLVTAPYYLWRMRRRGGYREDFGNRFGRIAALPPKPPGVKRIWLQAVSVGEILAVGPLLEAWAADPAVEVYLTTTTSTGHRLAQERYAGKVLALGYFPLDFWSFSARAWTTVQADLAVLTEGERWPEHVAQAARRGVPAACINARMSDRSFARMKPFGAFWPSLLGGITRIAAAAAEDAARFRELGFAPDRIGVTGNLKLDVRIQELNPEERRALRDELGLGADDLILLGASTWSGEEAALLMATRRAREAGIPCRVLLVPRHAERGDEVEEVIRDGGWTYLRRSRQRQATGLVEVALADTTGELQRLIQVADLVFVGKTLPPHTEGQTPVEAAALGSAIIVGPGTSNFATIVRQLQAVAAVETVADIDTLVDRVVAMLRDGGRRKRVGEAARAWHATNRGALERTLQELNALLVAD